MSYDLFDEKQVEGQISIEDMFPAPEKMFAVSKVFARAKKQMSLNELKTFVYALTNVRWTEECPEVIYIDKKVLSNVLNNHSDSDHLSQNLFDEIKDLNIHSQIQISDPDSQYFESGCLVTRVVSLKNRFKIKLEKDYLPLFGNLENNYITMWSSDIFKMSSARSVEFYEDLRLSSDTRGVCSKGFGIKALKELFGIPKDGEGSYMREKGGFDRSNFEKKVIQPLCDDLKKCQMIQLIPQAGGLMYEKVKQNGRVLGYRFYWTVSDRPGIMSAAEMTQTRLEVEKNPEVLKVAKDIINNKKKPKKDTRTQREYDFDELEKTILSN